MRAVIIALCVFIILLIGGLTWFVVYSLNSQGFDRLEPEDVADLGLESGAIDSWARIELVRMGSVLEQQRETIAALEARLQTLENRPSAGAGSSAPIGPVGGVGIDRGPNDIIDNYAQVVIIPNRRNVNQGLKVGGPRFLEQFLGRPRETLSDTCQPMTNPKLKAMLKVEQVGPIRVSMLQPALDSLRRVFANVEAADPDLYARINTAGALCVRQIRGTRGRTSTHSFGLAVDLNIDGQLDTLGDGKTQLGLTIIADFFREEGWVWGASFSREDSMHFEVSRQKLEEWRADGKI